jgi:hypothetical protein
VNLIEQRFDVITRRAAAGTSRRRSFMALGGAALAAVAAGPTRTEAAKAGKKARKKALKKCRRQVGQCHEFLGWACPDQPCEQRLGRCCSSFARCDASSALQCIFEPEPDET